MLSLRYQPTTIEKVESDIGYTVRKKMTVEELYMDRDNQIDAIEKTFRDAEKPITSHYSKPHVHPVEVLPVLPDSNMWKYPCAQVNRSSLCLPCFTIHCILN